MPKYKCLECLDCRELFYGWSINDRCQRCGGELREADDDDKKYPDNQKHKENIKELSNIRLRYYLFRKAGALKSKIERFF